MEKHTPGPLFGPFASRADAINGYPFGMGGLIVKRNHAYWLDLEPLLVTDAAPDLLAALTRIEDQLVTLIAIRELTGEGLIMADGLINLARASIHQCRLEV